MVVKGTPTKEGIAALLEELPAEALEEVATFIHFQRYKLSERGEGTPSQPRFEPTPMGGLWKGVTITDEDLAEARREMWGRFADDEL
jgi:hypothetical protein